jgi:hypothetical protein
VSHFHSVSSEREHIFGHPTDVVEGAPLTEALAPEASGVEAHT